MTNYDAREITIYRASPGTLTGRIDEVGKFMLPVMTAILGERLDSMFGNGTPTPWLIDTPKEVEFVLVGSRRYRVMPEDQVTVCHDERTEYLKPIPCPHCGR